MSKRKRRVAAPKKKGPLDQLTGEEAATVLRLFLERHPELWKETEALAKSVIGDVSIEDVADAVEGEIRALDLEDLNSRAGSHAYGYIEPSEAAWELVEETVMPFLDDIKRRVESGQFDAALASCAGVVLGLYRLRDNNRDEFLGWAPDSPDEMAGEAVVALRKALRKAKTARGDLKDSASLPAVFRENAPEWADMLERCWRRPS
jgi:hypothetical protein